MNKIDKKALEYQSIPFKYINDLEDIKNNCDKGFGITSTYLALAVSCFNYGIMVGKRQERVKYKKRDIK